jgi:lactate permease
MLYFIWLLPTLAVALAIISGRLNTTQSALLGLLASMPVALFSGPLSPTLAQMSGALSRGMWIGIIIAPYILGGLLFWQVAMHEGSVRPDPLRRSPSDCDRPERQRRRQLFFACFLVGPFAESATGFGVGMLGTALLLRHFGLAPRHLMIFALMSQTLIPWGGMGSGTLLAAAYARLPAEQVGLYSVGPVALLMLVWLPLYWRTARAAGLGGSLAAATSEVGWVVAGLLLLALATAYLGPETALLAAYGPLIGLRYLIDVRPSRGQLALTVHRALPYILLIGALVLSRLLPGVRGRLQGLGQLAPYPDLPSWSPLFHAGTWLIVGAMLTAFARGLAPSLRQEARQAWQTGKHAVLTVFLFAMMAELLSTAGISQAFAQGMFATLQAGAVLATPLISGTFGILANSGNAPNSLFMPSQLALAMQAGLSVPAVVALQHVSGTCLSLFSPVRMSIAAGLANGHGQTRRVYRQLLGFAIAAFVLLLALAAGIVWAA